MSARRPSPGPTGEAAICERLVADAAALCGARRVLLVLEAKAGEHVAAFLLPRREQPAVLLAAIEPWLDEARRSGKAKLRHGPEGVEAHRQRSCIVAPLGSGRERLGFLYADIDGRHGRFAAADRDRLAALARHTASHLADTRRADALALAVEERSSELAVINSIQQGLVAQLDLNAIVDLVGDKLREVFATGDLSICWLDEAGRVATPAYFYEHGVRRDDVAPFGLWRNEVNMRVVRERVGVAVNSREVTSQAVPGTELPVSYMRAPVVSAGRVIAIVNVDDFERENAFGDDDVLVVVSRMKNDFVQAKALLEAALRLIPGKHRINLHSIYAEFESKPPPRNEQRPEHFAHWVDWATRTINVAT
jgi:CBS domain-containing protein